MSTKVSTEPAGRHLHCVQALDPLLGGGLASATLGLHNELRRQGKRSVVVSTSGKRSMVNVPDVHAYERTCVTRMFLSIPLWRAAPAAVSSADFIHLHGLYVATGWAIGRSARRQRVPIVVHPHGMFEPYILRRSRIKKKIAHWLFEDANISAARLWRALTVVEADQIRAIVPNAAVAVVPNGVDIPLSIARHYDTRRVGYLGRLHEKKGIPLLLDAWARLAPRFPHWELAIAGPGDPDYVDTIRRSAKQLPRVVVHDAMLGQAKNHFLASLNLFILPSLSEGFPMAVLEAMATGVPVIVTRTSNAPAVDGHHAGWTCEPDAESIADAIIAALESGISALMERGAAARSLVRRDYTWERVALALIDACEAA